MFNSIFDDSLNKKTGTYTPKSGLINGFKTDSTHVNVEVYIQPTDGVLSYGTGAGQTSFAVIARDQAEIKRDGIITIDTVKYSIVELEEFNQVDIIPEHYQLILEKHV